ncbi:MAG TPA: SCP2 sterol-binding domain-containing protein [Clostridia bacterium]|nr:SCP2 sterol-binding domain-containing protein [Clostridia bacterium]
MPQEAIKELEKKLDPQKTSGINGIYQFDLTGDKGIQFFISFANGKGTFGEGINEGANITLTVSDENFAKILEGKLNPNLAFMTGKLKIKGDMQLALKLQAILG